MLWSKAISSLVIFGSILRNFRCGYYLLYYFSPELHWATTTSTSHVPSTSPFSSCYRQKPCLPGWLWAARWYLATYIYNMIGCTIGGRRCHSVNALLIRFGKNKGNTRLVQRPVSGSDAQWLGVWRSGPPCANSQWKRTKSNPSTSRTPGPVVCWNHAEPMAELQIWLYSPTDIVISIKMWGWMRTETGMQSHPHNMMY